MIIVEHGEGNDSAANSYADLESLLFHGSYYRYPIPHSAEHQVEYLLRACAAMDKMQWKGRPASQRQRLAWPRADVVLSGEFLSATSIPYGIRHGQVMLAIELYAADQGIELPQPTHSFDGKKRVPLTRSTAGQRNHPPLWVESRTQFADYLVMRGLLLVRGRLI
jgi:hypothetical protein